MPINLSLYGATDTTTTLTWSDINAPQASEYEIEYGPSGFMQGTGTTITVASNIATINDLVAETEYDAYVRSICNTDDASNWSDVISFTTEETPPSCLDIKLNCRWCNRFYSNMQPNTFS